MNDFLMFYAPFIVLIAGIVAAFVVAPMDGDVYKQIKREEKEQVTSGRHMASAIFIEKINVTLTEQLSIWANDSNNQNDCC